jgi:hypothetical protein
MRRTNLAATALAGAAAVAATIFPAASPAAADSWGPCSGYTKWVGTWGGQYTAWYPTEGTGTYDVNCILRWNPDHFARGAGVRVLQQALNLCYDAGLTVDGVYGSATAVAVADARNAEGLDGRWYDYAPYLREALHWPNWHYTSRDEWHYHCVDNSLARR